MRRKSEVRIPLSHIRHCLLAHDIFSRTRKDGDKKFSMNQNLTVLFVLRKTLNIIIEANRCAADEKGHIV